MSENKDIAIIGMSCIFPGAPNLETYWQNIVSKVDAVGDPPADWEAELFYDPDAAGNDRIYCKRGGYIGDLLTFRPSDFGVMPMAVDGADPDHFVGLKIAGAALEDAGYLERKFNGERCDVIIGRGTYINRGFSNQISHCFVVDELIRLLKQLHPEHSDEELQAVKRHLKESLPQFTADVAPGLVPNVMAGRIANRFDLMGSSYTVDAACASSVIALEHGVRALQIGACDMALVGGANVATTPPMLTLFCLLNALSRKQQIRPFSKTADGTLLGEGYGMVVLKRRQDAERDGDRVYAFVKGVGSASDGRALSVLAPRIEGEELAIRRAYANADLPPETIGLIEAHGTGTTVGDAVEVQALRRVFGERKEGEPPCCALGTVKSMISHLIPAAGIAGLIKTALSLHHKVLPPTIHCEDPNPELELESTTLYLNTETRPWIHGGDTPRRGGVNAFGFGGINSHAILEEAPSEEETAVPSMHHEWDSEVIVIESNDQSSLLGELNRLETFLAEEPDIALKDIAATYNTRLNKADWRIAIVAISLNDLRQKIATAVEKLDQPECRRIRNATGIYFFREQLARQGSLAFLFPGEGSQYINMLADLCLHFPEVRKWFDLMDRAFTGHHRGFLPSQIVFPPPDPEAGEIPQDEQLFGMDCAVEAVFAANQALGALMKQLGITPDVVLGHSTGEYSALIDAGVIQIDSNEQLIGHILELNKVYENALERGDIPEAKLLAVGATDPAMVEEVVAQSEGPLYISMDNCPHQVVLCGTEETTSWAADLLAEKGAVCQHLPFDRAYHTPLFEAFCTPLRKFFGSLGLKPQKREIYTCVTSAPYPKDIEKINDLAVIQWANPVRFRETIERMYADGVRLFVEIGPRGNLSAFVEDTLRGRPMLAVPADLQNRSGTLQLNHMVAQLAAQGVSMRLDHLYARRAPRILDITPGQQRTGDDKKAAADIKLTGALCGLRIPPNISLASANRAQADTATDTAVNAIGHGSVVAAAQTPITPRSESVQGTAISGIDNRSSASFRAQPGNAGSRSVAMQAYMNTMEQFLSSQEEIIQALLCKKKAYPSPAVSSGGHWFSQTSANVESGTVAVTKEQDNAPDYPLISNVLSLEQGKSLRARCEIRTDEDLFLLHHTIGSRKVTSDGRLSALPVVPLTMSMEIMAQAASLLNPGKLLVGMKEVRGYRWVGLDKGILVLETEAVQRAPGDGIEVDVQVYEVSNPVAARQPPQNLVIEGTMLFADEYPQPPVFGTSFPLEQERPSRWYGDVRYRDGMFHGPLFQAVEKVNRTGIDGTEATLEVLSREGLFRNNPDPHLVTDPVILDAAGQVVGYWALEHLGTGFNVFPFRLEALRLYSASPAPSERVSCRARLTNVSETETRSDIDLVRVDGTLWMHLEGWWDRRFDMPLPFYRFRITPLEIVLSRALPQGVTHFPQPEKFRCFLLDSVPENLLLTGWMIWARVLAHLILTQAEREQWWALDLPEAQKIEWLLGRTVAKDTIRILLRETYDLTVYPADIEISVGVEGQLTVKGDWLNKVPEPLLLSVSYCGGNTCAVAGGAENIVGLGIDLADLSRIQENAPTDRLSATESALIDRLDSSQRKEWLFRVACAKKALRKALSSDASVSSIDFPLQNIDLDNGRVNLGLAGDTGAALHQQAGMLIAVDTCKDGNLIIATAGIMNPSSNRGRIGN